MQASVKAQTNHESLERGGERRVQMMERKRQRGKKGRNKLTFFFFSLTASKENVQTW